MLESTACPKNRNRHGADFQAATVPRPAGAGAVPILNLQRPSRSVGPELYRAVLACRYGNRQRTDASR
jgi:hypothetical protein